GSYQAPDYFWGTTTPGPQAVSSTGQNTVIDGLKVIGLSVSNNPNGPGNQANIYVTNGTVENSSAHSIVLLSGSLGNDTLLLQGPRSDYSVTVNADGSVTIADNVPNRDLTHTYTDITHFQFSDGVILSPNDPPTLANVAATVAVSAGQTVALSPSA